MQKGRGNVFVPAALAYPGLYIFDVVTRVVSSLPFADFALFAGGAVFSVYAAYFVMSRYVMKGRFKWPAVALCLTYMLVMIAGYNFTFEDTTSRLYCYPDEYGQTVGIVTLEDLLEEIVGNIYDEFDPQEEKEIQKIDDGVWKVSGSLSLSDFSDETGIELEENEDYDTIGGMVLSTLSQIPEDGTTLHTVVGGLDIQVTKIEDRRIEEAIVKKAEPEKEETETKESEKKEKSDEE